MDEDPKKPGNGDDREKLRRARRERARNADYSVGYAKAPEQHQFTPGHKRSATTRKSKKRKSYGQLIYEISNEETPVYVKGRRTKMTNTEFKVRKMISDASQGDKKADAQWTKDLKEFDRPAVEEQEDNIDWNAILRNKIEAMVQKRAEVRASEAQASSGAQPSADEKPETTPPDTKRPGDKES